MENTATLSYNITVLDLTAPVLSETPGDLVVDCDAEVPAPPAITAEDNCEGLVEVIFTETYEGEMPNENAVDECDLISPISPFYDPDWALWLQNFPGGEYYTLVDGDFVAMEDGSATLIGTVVSIDNPQAGWDFSILLENGLGWDEWSTQDFPTSYKDDFNAAGDEYLNWIYYIINSEVSELEGWGDFEGTTLSLSHAPASLYYGYQLGIAANNVNAEYGSGGWIYYEGVFNDLAVSGAGDFAFNHECCPDYSIVRTWTATDCSENTVTYTQTITFGDLEEDPTAEAGGDNWTDVALERESDSVHHIFPNPAVTKSTVAFQMDRNGMTKVEVFSLAGAKLSEVFNDRTEAGTQYRADIDVAGFADGIYLVRLTHNGQITTDRLVISK